MTANDTIYALSSGAGRSAVAVIRVSGPQTGKIISALAGSLPAPSSFSLRKIRDPATGEILDQAVVVWRPAPRSFTGEDCAEFHLHGSAAVVGAVMSALSGERGVRPAEKGEFTLRAFLNGKMDLVEVEGLSDLLDARTASQRRQAYRQMSGIASGVFDSWREQLLLIRADIEAVVDFADEPGIAEEATPGIDVRIHALLEQITGVVDRAPSAAIVRDGVRVVLAGLPNTGKSSLLNTLAQREAAIVSDVPGTTRDAIEVSLDIRGIPVILTDTAGLRAEFTDKVEEEGIRRSRRHISEADVVVWVWSSDVAGSETPQDTVPALMVRNKCDLRSGLFRNEDHLEISTVTGAGVQRFVDGLWEHLQKEVGHVESSLLVSERQIAAARNSIRYLNEAMATPVGHLEIKAEAIRQASDEIGRLTGKLGVEDWLGVIFSRFCIGK